MWTQRLQSCRLMNLPINIVSVDQNVENSFNFLKFLIGSSLLLFVKVCNTFVLYIFQFVQDLISMSRTL